MMTKKIFFKEKKKLKDINEGVERRASQRNQIPMILSLIHI